MVAWPGESADERCLRVASMLGTEFRRCTTFDSGQIATVSGENLGSLDLLTTIGSSLGSGASIDVDEQLLARRVEAYIDSVRAVTLLEERLELTIDRVNDEGLIYVYQYIYGLKVRNRNQIKVDPLTQRVTRLAGFYYQHSDVEAPTDAWVQQHDAFALATHELAAELGSVGNVRLHEAKLEWEPTSDGLRPIWFLLLQTEKGAWFDLVDAISGMTSITDGSVP